MDIVEFVKELKSYDYTNFANFYQLTNKQIYFSALNILKDHSLAQDIMQETYISFLNNIESYKIGHNIYAYLSTIARNLSINLYNKLKRTTLNDELINKESYLQNPMMETHIEEILNLLDETIEREIVTYHAIFDYKFNDIAKIVKKPLGTVLWIYNKAIKKLKERIVIENEK